MSRESLSSSTSRLVAMASFMAFSFICMCVLSIVITIRHTYYHT